MLRHEIDNLYCIAERICIVPECGRPVWVRLFRGRPCLLCSMHYQRQRRHEQTSRLKYGNEIPCAVHGCENMGGLKGYCSSHYSSLRRRGSPIAPRLTAWPYTAEEDRQLLQLLDHTRDGVGRARLGEVRDLAFKFGRNRKSASQRLGRLRNRRIV